MKKMLLMFAVLICAIGVQAQKISNIRPQDRGVMSKARATKR